MTMYGADKNRSMTIFAAVGLKRAAVIAALAGIMTLSAPANAEVIPDPSAIVTNGAFTLGAPTTEAPTGGYIVLAAIDKTINSWTITDMYSSFTLNDKWIYDSGSITITPKPTVNVPNSATPVELTLQYETSVSHIDNMDSDIATGTVFAEQSNAGKGGAILNEQASPYNITGTVFLKNHSSILFPIVGAGGAIYNSGSITGISDSTFISNTADGGGGAIYNCGTITNGITNSTFISNTITGSMGKGGAINNSGTITNGITNSTFISNTATYHGGAINNDGTITGISDSTFISNTAGDGGAIYNSGTITNGITNSTFISNTSAQNGGAINNYYGDAKINSITNSTFISNAANNGGAIWNSGYRKQGRRTYYATISSIANSTFTSNTATGSGGAIWNDATLSKLTNIKFISNSAGQKGGAVYTKSNQTFVSDAGDTVFYGNTDSTGSNAIYLDKSGGILTFDIKNGGSTYMYDAINGVSGYKVAITGADKTSDKMYLFNDIKNAGQVSIGGVELNTINNNIHTYNFNTLNLTSDINMAVDVDLAAETMDRLTATSVTGGGTVNVVGMNLMTDATKDETKILFADTNLADKVTPDVLELGYGASNPYQTTAFAPIYKYTAIYNVDPTDNKGYYEFSRSSGGGNDPESYNPAVLSEPVAAQAQIMAINNIVTNYAFHHVDTNFIHQHNKLSSRYANRYAIAETNLIKDDLNTNNPLFIEPKEESVWVKPFVTFENIPLKNGPNVKSINYGTLVGYDSQVFHHKRGWDGVWTGYVGYNGSNMHYSGVDSTSNGGLLGATYSLYKGNFFNATTLTTGAMNTQARTMYGNDNMTSLYAGVGNKVGYNFNFKEGLFTIQPSFLISYTFGKTFDFTNAAGVRINSDPLHAIQLSPGIKFFMNTKNGWQPYIGVNMMWNIMDQTHTRANGVRLPEMSVKPYVQYGIGIQKTMKDHFTAYGQAMIQNGGRNGISLTGGFKWAIGRDHKKIEKVQRQDVKRTVIKDKKQVEKVNNPNPNDSAITQSPKAPLNSKNLSKSAKQESVLKPVKTKKTTTQSGQRHVLKG